MKQPVQGVKKEEKKVKATEKLAIVERALLNAAKRIGELEMMVFTLANDLDKATNLTILLNKKLDSVIELVKPTVGEAILSEKSISDTMTLLKERELAGQVENGLKAGQIQASSEVTNNSFVVAKELTPGTDEVVNPRIQFAVEFLSQENKEKFIGKKVGERITSGEGKLDLILVEVYDIVKDTSATMDSGSENNSEEAQQA